MRFFGSDVGGSSDVEFVEKVSVFGRSEYLSLDVSGMPRLLAHSLWSP
ncbi:hypothetical protein BVI1335_120034 [Burkholderia vietnamiensis]|nr:hypothetical protein BVI1335_120034 [Burkholderia vietnamiensis]